MIIDDAVIHEKEVNLEKWLAEQGLPGAKVQFDFASAPTVKIKVLKRASKTGCHSLQSLDSNLTQEDWRVLRGADFGSHRFNKLLDLFYRNRENGVPTALMRAQSLDYPWLLRTKFAQKSLPFTIRAINDPGHRKPELSRVYKIFKKPTA